MKTVTHQVDEMVDMVLKPSQHVEIEVQKQVGSINKVKLYVHVDGKTVLRIGFINPDNIDLKLGPIL